MARLRVAHHFPNRCSSADTVPPVAPSRARPPQGGYAGPMGERERWNERWTLADEREPSAFLQSLAPRLPPAGRALDVAGGPGHEAAWLSARGLEVTLVDVSDVALGRARERAPRLHTLQLDLEQAPLPEGPFVLIVCLHYLQRALFPQLARRLAPGGLLVFAQATQRNLERHPRPPTRFLLDEGELNGLVRGLEVVSLTEDWTPEGRHEARLVARRR